MKFSVKQRVAQYLQWRSSGVTWSQCLPLIGSTGASRVRRGGVGALCPGALGGGWTAGRKGPRFRPEPRPRRPAASRYGGLFVGRAAGEPGRRSAGGAPLVEGGAGSGPGGGRVSRMKRPASWQSGAWDGMAGVSPVPGVRSAWPAWRQTGQKWVVVLIHRSLESISRPTGGVRSGGRATADGDCTAGVRREAPGAHVRDSLPGMANAAAFRPGRRPLV